MLASPSKIGGFATFFINLGPILLSLVLLPTVLLVAQLKSVTALFVRIEDSRLFFYFIFILFLFLFLFETLG